MEIGDIAAGSTWQKSRKDHLNADPVKITVIITRFTLCDSTFLGRRKGNRLFPQPTYFPSLIASVTTGSLFLRMPHSIRIPAKVVNLVLPFVRNVQRHLGQNFHQIKHLKIARQAFPEPVIPRPRKPYTFAFIGPIDHLSIFRNLDHSRQRKRTVRNMRDQTLQESKPPVRLQMT
jgi:hypothetical protein